MKILITGYTSRMFGHKNTRKDYVTFVYILEDILKEMGHEVDRKYVELGERVAYLYDYAFCGLAPLNSITSWRVAETHYVLDQMLNRCCFFADDWSFCTVGRSIRNMLKRWDSYLSYKNFPYKAEDMEPCRKSLEFIATVDNPWNNRPTLAPMFPWGDHDFLIRNNFKTILHTIDPSPWVKYPSIEVPKYYEKKKQWVMAALSNHMLWVDRQHLHFPLVYVGNKSLGPWLTEDATIQLFADSSGVLSTRYQSAGSGWWRTRYLNAVWAETPIYSDPKDAAIMGKAFQGSAGQFEREYGLPEYEKRVEGQRDWLNANLGTKEKAISTLERLLAK